MVPVAGGWTGAPYPNLTDIMFKNVQMTDLDIESQLESYELSHKIDRLASARTLRDSLYSDKTSVDDIRNLPKEELQTLTDTLQVVSLVALANAPVLMSVFRKCLPEMRAPEFSRAACNFYAKWPKKRDSI